MQGIQIYGKNWKLVQTFVGTRTSTQARSHAQKVLKGKLDQLEFYKGPMSPEIKKEVDFFAPLVEFEEDSSPEENENGSPIFKVEKDNQRVKARKRLFSTPDSYSQKLEMVKTHFAVNTKLDFSQMDKQVEEIKEELVPEELVPEENTFDYVPRKKRNTMVPEIMQAPMIEKTPEEENQIEQIFDEPMINYEIDEQCINSNLSDIEMLDSIERKHSSPFEEMEQQIDREMNEQLLEEETNPFYRPDTVENQDVEMEYYP